LHVLHKRRNHLDALFRIQFYLYCELRPSLVETVLLLVPARYDRDFSLFNICLEVKTVLIVSELLLLILLVGTLKCKTTLSLDHILERMFLYCKNISCIQYEYIRVYFISHRNNNRLVRTYWNFIVVEMIQVVLLCLLFVGMCSLSLSLCKCLFCNWQVGHWISTYINNKRNWNWITSNLHLKRRTQMEDVCGKNS
jgi:hypothetical protein